MQTRWPGGSNRDAIRPPDSPVIEPLHNSLHEGRRIRVDIPVVARVRPACS